MKLFTQSRFPLPVQHEAVVRDWQARGYSCDWFVDPPGRAWLDFVHRTNELVTVVEGRLELSVGDQIFVLEPGDEVMIPRGAVHSMHNVYVGTTRWLYGYD
jgi:mannose-6-phosphate isomerase-like protein (cupin superfamily)